MMVVLTLFIILLIFLYFYLTKNYSYWKKLKVKSPEPIIFFGNIKDSALRRKSYNDLFREIYEQFPKEKVVGVYRMTSPALLLRDPEIIKHIYIRDFDNFITRGIQLSKQDIGTTLFHSDANSFKALRSKHSPIFTTVKLKSEFPILLESADKFLQFLAKELKKSSEVKIYENIKRYTISAISASAFSLDIAPDDEESHKRLNEIHDLAATLNFVNEATMLYPGILNILGITVFPNIVKEFFAAFTKRLVDARDGKPTARNDFVDEMLKFQLTRHKDDNSKSSKDKKFEVSDSVIAAQVFQFFIAGYETSGTTLSILCHTLAKREDIKQKLIIEIETTLKAHDNILSYDCVNDMVYMENVLLESLRMYPILDPLQRMAETDYYVPEVDLTIEKGTVVLVSASGLQYDEKYYPEPHEFRPERFDDPHLKEMMQAVYMPFGTGPRYCVGMRMGKLQAKVLLTKLLQNFDILPSVKHAPLQFRTNNILLYPVDGIPLRLVPRKKLA